MQISSIDNNTYTNTYQHQIVFKGGKIDKSVTNYLEGIINESNYGKKNARVVKKDVITRFKEFLSYFNKYTTLKIAKNSGNAGRKSLLLAYKVSDGPEYTELLANDLPIKDKYGEYSFLSLISDLKPLISGYYRALYSQNCMGIYKFFAPLNGSEMYVTSPFNELMKLPPKLLESFPDNSKVQKEELTKHEKWLEEFHSNISTKNPHIV